MICMDTQGCNLVVLPYSLAVVYVAPGSTLPDWALRGPWYSITKTSDELSVVCEEQYVPDTVRSEKGWRCIKVQGPLDFGLTGILASLANPLAKAGISIFAVSTFETDYLLLKEERLQEAIAVLKDAGHTFIA